MTLSTIQRRLTVVLPFGGGWTVEARRGGEPRRLCPQARRVNVPSGTPSSFPLVEGDYLRRAIAEFVGTFALIFVGAGAIMTAGGSTTRR